MAAKPSQESLGAHNFARQGSWTTLLRGNACKGEEFTSQFFSPLQQDSSELRIAAAESLIAELRASAESEDDIGKELCRTHVPRLVHLAMSCPFLEIRNVVEEFLNFLRDDLRWELPSSHSVVSTFFSQDDLAKESYLFEDVFIGAGRVTNIDRILAWHPDYLEPHGKLFSFLMNQEGPLPIEWRNFIGIMAASLHNCEYIVHIQSDCFVANGGDPDWLKGLEHVPLKLAKLSKLNTLLARQPWRLSKTTIEELIRPEDQVEAWSLAELVQAIVLIAEFHALASLVWGCGIVSEAHLGGPTIEEPRQALCDPANATDNTKTLQKLLQEQSFSLETSSDGGIDQCADQEAAFAEVELSDSDASVDAEGLPRAAPGSSVLGAKYSSGYTLNYEDFDTRKAQTETEYKLFRISDYSWSDQGYSLVSQFYCEAAPLLDDVFRRTADMTKNMMFDNHNVNTLPFRRAVWFYVHRIMGVFHDDYNYREPNIFLNINIKQYIKKVTVSPWVVTAADITGMGYALQPEEKCHITLLALESRKQAELLYGLHAVMNAIR